MLLNHEELFLKTVEDLRQKLDNSGTYEIIRAAGLCRHLLLDEWPLVHDVNRKLKLPLRFHVKDFTELKQLFNSNLAEVWVSLAPLGKSVFVNRKQFLAIEPLRIENNIYSVKDIIKTAAHYLGGVHSGKPSDQKQIEFTRVKAFDVRDKTTAYFAIKSICKIVLDAMEPLEQRIMEQQK